MFNLFGPPKVSVKDLGNINKMVSVVNSLIKHDETIQNIILSPIAEKYYQRELRPVCGEKNNPEEVYGHIDNFIMWVYSKANIVHTLLGNDKEKWIGYLNFLSERADEASAYLNTTCDEKNTTLTILADEMLQQTADTFHIMIIDYYGLLSELRIHCYYYKQIFSELYRSPNQ